MYLNDNSAPKSLQLLLVGVAIKVRISPAKTMARKNMDSAIESVALFIFYSVNSIDKRNVKMWVQLSAR